MILKFQLFALGILTAMSVGLDANTANFTLLAVIALTTFGSAVIKLRSDSRQEKKLAVLQTTADKTHSLVNSDSEKHMAIHIVTLKALAGALDTIASNSKKKVDAAAAKAAHNAIKVAEKALTDHQIAQAGVDGAEKERRTK